MLPSRPNCCVDRRDERVADEDVLVLFLDDLVARRRHRLDHVLARRQADQRLAGEPGCRRSERVRRDVGRARELRSGRRRAPPAPGSSCASRRSSGTGPACTVGRPDRACVYCARTGRPVRCARALHVGLGLPYWPSHRRQVDEVVPARGLRGVDQRQGLGAVRQLLLAIQVHRHARNQRLPDGLHVEALVVERARGRIHHDALDATVLAGHVGRAAPVDAVALADEALHAVGIARLEFRRDWWCWQQHTAGPD